MNRFLGVVIISIFFSAYAVNTRAQCMMSEVSLQDRCHEASVVVEGRILGSYSFWDVPHKNIYTCYSIEVSKVFKGDNTTRIEIITVGGTAEGMTEWVSYGLRLNEGDYGVFFLKPLNIEYPVNISAGKEPLQVVAAAQGFIQFNEAGSTASDGLHTYNNIGKEVYQPLEQYTRQTMRVTGKINPVKTIPTRGAILISSFSPDTISAGTKSVITIHGTGFGNSRLGNSIGFKNADNGGGSYLLPDSTQYILWSDTLIKALVPSNSGTGTIRVSISGNHVVSAKALTIIFSRFNYYKASTPGVYQANFIGRNGKGYTWKYNDEFITNEPAKEAFIRAFNSWRCGTLVNWKIDEVNTSASSELEFDGTSVISFDLNNTLPTGIYGVCGFFTNECIDSLKYVSELDIIFRVASNWNYTTATPKSNEYDFESTAVHELGHGHQLGHVIDIKDVMHYGHYYGQIFRILNERNLTCGEQVMAGSITIPVCSYPVMTALTVGTCQFTSGVEEIENKKASFIIYPNPADNILTIENTTAGSTGTNSQFMVTDAIGKVISTFKVQGMNKNFDINTRDWPQGIYFLSPVNRQTYCNTYKIVILHQ